MVKKVLIVDDDQEMLLSLEEGLSKYDETFSIITAEDGLGAVDELKNSTISLVVTDLKMPKMDGFSLLSHIMEHYPEIPVVIITGYSTSDMERLAREGGAIGYIAKPFMIDDLAKRIITALRKEADGGTLHSVSSGIFLQLMEMEEKTCTVRLVEKSSGKQGILFFPGWAAAGCPMRQPPGGGCGLRDLFVGRCEPQHPELLPAKREADSSRSSSDSARCDAPEGRTQAPRARGRLPERSNPTPGEEKIEKTQPGGKGEAVSEERSG